MVDGREGADERIGDVTALSNNRGSADDAVADVRAGLHGDVALQHRVGRDRRAGVHGMAHPRQHLPVRRQNILHLAGVDPEAAQQVRADVVALVDEPLNGVGDLQLPARGGRDALGGLEDMRIEAIHADQRQITGGHAGLFDEATNARLIGQLVPIRAGLQLRHAELGRVLHRREQDTALIAAVRRREGPHDGIERLADQVVAQEHDESLVREELARGEHGVREAERRLLLNELDPHLPSPPGAVADRRTNLLMGIAHHDAQVTNPGRHERLDRIEQHRLVGEREQLLGAGEGEGTQACPLPPTENQPLHPRPLPLLGELPPRDPMWPRLA